MIAISKLFAGQIFKWHKGVYQIIKVEENFTTALQYMYVNHGRWNFLKSKKMVVLPKEIEVQRVRIKLENY